MTPCILAVDCGGEFASLALSRGGEVLEEAVLHSPEGFGGLVFDQLDGLLARHKTRIGDIDCFGAAAGPGSFTGLRIALSAVKGLAEACGKPALAVSNLEAMASFGAHSRRAQTPRTLAAAVARIASERFVAGRSVDPAALDANYVRRSDAELSWKEM
jgi:tRNA threonylcarbamoyl adenosine modification protein YeaZ